MIREVGTDFANLTGVTQDTSAGDQFIELFHEPEGSDQTQTRLIPFPSLFALNGTSMVKKVGVKATKGGILGTIFSRSQTCDRITTFPDRTSKNQTRFSSDERSSEIYFIFVENRYAIPEITQFQKILQKFRVI